MQKQKYLKFETIPTALAQKNVRIFRAMCKDFLRNLQKLLRGYIQRNEKACAGGADQVTEAICGQRRRNTRTCTRRGPLVSGWPCVGYQHVTIAGSVSFKEAQADLRVADASG